VDAPESAPAESPNVDSPVAFLLGMGRSGTNFLLDLLDTSPLTHCRNEPDELPGGALESWSEWKIHRSLGMEADPWADIRLVIGRGGERDRPIPPWKSWVRKAASSSARALSKKGLRNLVPGLGGAEFRLPPALIRPEEFSKAVHVLKINAAPSVAEVFLEDSDHLEPQRARVLHIVRNPAGFLRSWRRRWLAEHDHDEVLEANLARIEEVLRQDPEGGAFLSAFEEPNVHESELLFWRYCTQRIREAGRRRSGYLEVSYDELSRTPLTSLRVVFEFLDLPWTEDVTARIEEMTDRSVDIARAFEAELDDDALTMFERTLGPELCAEFELSRA